MFLFQKIEILEDLNSKISNVSKKKYLKRIKIKGKNFGFVI